MAQPLHNAKQDLAPNHTTIIILSSLKSALVGIKYGQGSNEVFIF